MPLVSRPEVILTQTTNSTYWVAQVLDQTNPQLSCFVLHAEPWVCSSVVNQMWAKLVILSWTLSFLPSGCHFSDLDFWIPDQKDCISPQQTLGPRCETTNSGHHSSSKCVSPSVCCFGSFSNTFRCLPWVYGYLSVSCLEECWCAKIFVITEAGLLNFSFKKGRDRK